MDVDALQSLVPPGLLAAGLLLYHAWKLYRESKDKREETLLGRWREEIARIERENDNLRRDLDFAEQESDWWRNRAGDLEHVLRSNGVEVPTPSTPKPRRGNGDVQ